MNCPQVQKCYCFSFWTSSIIRLIALIWSGFWWKRGNATKGKQQANNNEVRTQVGKLRRILMSLYLQNQDNFVDFANFVLVWREILNICLSQIHVEASRQLEPGPSHIKPGPRVKKKKAWGPTVPFHSISFHANDCLVIDSKAPGAFTGCAWDVDQSETRVLLLSEPGISQCQYVSWGGGIHIKSIIINDFSRVNPAAPGPPISYRHWTVSGLLLVFSYQADP